MAIVALVPLRSLSDGKRRLRGVLTERQRSVLVERLWERAYAALASSGVIERIAVVSPDQALLDRVRRPDLQTIRQIGTGLNAGLEQARRVVMAERAWSSLLVMLPDLPLIEPATIAAMTALGSSRGVVIASDRHGSGTNMLLLNPPDALSFAFGAGSFARHVHAAQRRGLALQRFQAAEAALDLDIADDLRELPSRYRELVLGETTAITSQAEVQGG